MVPALLVTLDRRPASSQDSDSPAVALAEVVVRSPSALSVYPVLLVPDGPDTCWLATACGCAEPVAG